MMFIKGGRDPPNSHTVSLRLDRLEMRSGQLVFASHQHLGVGGLALSHGFSSCHSGIVTSTQTAVFFMTPFVI